MSLDTSQIGMDIAELCVLAGLTKSKSEARKAIKNGAIRIQDMKVQDPFARVVHDSEKNRIIIVEKPA